MKPALAVLAALLATACASCHGPTEATGPLTGTWRSPPVPSGAGTYLVLQQSNGTVRGAVYDYGIGPSGQMEDEGTVEGQCLGELIDLRLHYQKAGAARFQAVLDTLGELVGTWTPPPPAAPFSTTYYRQVD